MSICEWKRGPLGPLAEQVDRLANKPKVCELAIGGRGGGKKRRIEEDREDHALLTSLTSRQIPASAERDEMMLMIASVSAGYPMIVRISKTAKSRNVSAKRYPDLIFSLKPA